jgi:Concanavalin A-like lectin/glucanases superfamily
MTQPGAHFGWFEGTAAAAYYRITCFCMEFGEWTQIAASADADAGTLSLYVGGVLRTAMPITHTILPGSTTLYMGKWTGTGRLLVGDLDDTLIYRRALFPVEVAELSQAAPPNVQ